MRSFKFLPWRSLLEVSGLTTLVVVLLELLLALGEQQSAAVREALSILYAPPQVTLVLIATAIGMGALAVYFLERFYRRQVVINTGTLWALAACLGLLVMIKSQLPVPGYLIDFNQNQAIGAIVGIFWRGRPYWRW